MDCCWRSVCWPGQSFAQHTVTRWNAVCACGNTYGQHYQSGHLYWLVFTNSVVRSPDFIYWQCLLLHPSALCIYCINRSQWQGSRRILDLDWWIPCLLFQLVSYNSVLITFRLVDLLMQASLQRTDSYNIKHRLMWCWPADETFSFG